MSPFFLFRTLAMAIALAPQGFAFAVECWQPGQNREVLIDRLASSQDLGALDKEAAIQALQKQSGITCHQKVILENIIDNATAQNGIDDNRFFAAVSAHPEIERNQAQILRALARTSAIPDLEKTIAVDKTLAAGALTFDQMEVLLMIIVEADTANGLDDTSLFSFVSERRSLSAEIADVLVQIARTGRIEGLDKGKAVLALSQVRGLGVQQKAILMTILEAADLYNGIDDTWAFTSIAQRATIGLEQNQLLEMLLVSSKINGLDKHLALTALLDVQTLDADKQELLETIIERASTSNGLDDTRVFVATAGSSALHRARVDQLIQIVVRASPNNGIDDTAVFLSTLRSPQ